MEGGRGILKHLSQGQAMGKASRIKQQSAREKIAAQREAARRTERRNRMLITGGSTVVVLVIVLAFILVKATEGSPSSSGSSSGTALPASVSSQVTNVSPATLDRVGKGSVPATTHGQAAFSPGSGAALTSGGKPEMLYIGAEYCPYCAAMRWSMAVALSRFGTLTTPLHGIHSSSNDVYANTATLTFYKTGYHSPYLSFAPVENLTVNKTLLQNPTAAQNAVWAKYEPDPQTRGFPFVAFSNKFVMKAPIYSPAVLAGKSWSQIAASLKDPTSPVAQGVLGAANYITGAICKMTNDKPADVCSSPAVTAVQSGL
jgi:thiol-disulfide isomerase/thioredoxin